jgi:hypothetical protein
MRLCVKESILTNDALQLKGLTHGDNCPLRDQEFGSASHLTLNCPFISGRLASACNTANLTIRQSGGDS